MVCMYGIITTCGDIINGALCSLLQAVKVLRSHMCRQYPSYPHKEPVQVTRTITRNLSKQLPTQEATYTFGFVFVIESHWKQFFFLVCSCIYPLTKPHKTRLNVSLQPCITSSCELREEELEVSCLYIPLCCMQSKVNCNAIVLVTQFVVLQMQLPLKLSKRMRRLFPYLVSIHIHVLMYYMSGM